MAVTNDFTQSELDLNGKANIGSPTALVWGPDGRLYVTEQSGDVNVLTVEFGDKNPSDGDPTAQFYVSEAESLTEVKSIPNFNDDGSSANGNVRQVTGIDVTRQYDANGDQVFLSDGKPAVVIYVTSSDNRIGAGGGGNDANLDTNSGVITRLVQTEAGWETTDIVRGLPRSEENHATNGLEVIQELDDNGKLISERMIVASGGNANTGAPSNNFAGQQEQPLSGAILEVDLDELRSIEAADGLKTDPDSGRAYVYDLPTLDDPTRTGQTDASDPFGGNDGLNSAKLLEDGPVQIYSAGYRNPYDVEVTDDGRVYTYDNGANNNWGGRPAGEDQDGDTNSTEAENMASNNGLPPGFIATNLFVEDNNEIDGNFNPQNWDQLHEVTRSDDLDGRTLAAGLGGAQTYAFDHPDFDQPLDLVYGGHPNPTRAEGARAGVLYSPDAGVNNAKLMVSNVDKGAGTSDFLEVVDWLKTIGYSDAFINATVVAVDPGVRYSDSFAPGFGGDGANGRPTEAGVYSLVESASGPIGLPADIDEIVWALNPIEGNYLEAGYTDGAIDTGKGSINGLTEYTSTILDTADVKMSGSLIAASLNQGQYYIIGRDEDGVVQTTTTTNQAPSGSARTIAADRDFFQSGGAPLGLASIGDDLVPHGGEEAFQGSVWAAIYKQNGPVIEILQPGNPETNKLLPSYAGQEPSDPTDNDLDGVDHINDPFDFDADNGIALAAGKSIELNFSQVDLSANPDFSGTIGDTGLLGAMLDGNTPNRDAKTAADGFAPDDREPGLFDNAGNIIPGGNAPILQIKSVQDGTAKNGANTLLDGLQTGVRIDDDVQRLVSEVEIFNWYADQPGGGRVTGLSFGDGTQSNFLRLVWGDVDGGLGFEVGLETGDIYQVLTTVTDTAFGAALNAGNAPNQNVVTLQLEIADIGGDYDILARYKVTGQSDFTEIALDAQLPEGVLRDVLDGSHMISDGDTTLDSGAAVGIIAEKDDGVSFTAVDFNVIRVEAFGNEIAADSGAGVGATGTSGTDTVIYTGTETDLAPLAADVENFDGSASSADYTVTGNALSNTIKVGAGANTVTTGAGADVVRGTLDNLAGDRVTDFSSDDAVLIEGFSNADIEGVSYAQGSAIITINDKTFTLEGEAFEGDNFDPDNGGAYFDFTDTTDGLQITSRAPLSPVVAINAGGFGNVTGTVRDTELTFVGDEGGAVDGPGFTTPGATKDYTNPQAQNLDFPDTDLDPILASERSNGSSFSYEIAVPDGTYLVDLIFAEIYFGLQGTGGAGAGDGARVFDVEIEGAEVITNLDIHAEAGGAGKQLVKSIEVEVTDGTLNIDFPAISGADGDVNQNKLSGLVVWNVGGGFVPVDATDPVVEEISLENPQSQTDGTRTATVVVTDETGFEAADFAGLTGAVLQFDGYQPAAVADPTVTLSNGDKTATLTFEVTPQNSTWINGTTGTISLAAGAFNDAAGNGTAAASNGFVVQSNLAALERGSVVRAINIGTTDTDVGTLDPDDVEGGAIDNNAYGGAIAADTLITDAFGNPVAFEADSDAYHTSPKPSQNANVDGKSGMTGSNSGGIDLDGSAYHTYRDSVADSWTSTFDGFENGAYIVELHFAELFASSQAQSRVGDFTVNGVSFGDDYDAFVEGGGADKPSFVRLPVTVTDGTIQVLVDNITVGQAGYSAIVVYDAVDENTPATLSVADVTAVEGEDATITVTRTGDLSEATTVNVALSLDGTAEAGDVGALSADSVTFDAGQTSATLTLPVTDDDLEEGAETLSVTLSSPSGNAVIANGTATITIAASDSDLQAPVGTTILELDFDGVTGEALDVGGFDGALGTVAANVDTQTSEVENGKLVVQTAEGDINDGAPGSINDFTKSVDLSDPALTEIFLSARFDNPFTEALLTSQGVTDGVVPNFVQQGIVFGTGTQAVGEMVKLVWGGVANGTGTQIWSKGGSGIGIDQKVSLDAMLEAGKDLFDVASVEMSLVIDKDAGTVGQYVTLFDAAGVTIGGVRPQETPGFATAAPLAMPQAVLDNLTATDEATHVGVTSSDNSSPVGGFASFDASWDFLRLSSPQFTGDGPSTPADSVNGVAVAGEDFSDDRLAPSELGILTEGETVIVASQQGDDAPGGRERDYFKFTVEEGQELTGIFLDGFETDQTGFPQAFIGLNDTGTMPTDPVTFEGADQMLGGYIYNSGDVANGTSQDGNLIDELGDGNEQGIEFRDTDGDGQGDGFTPPLPAGTYTIWLNQGGDLSTATLRLVTAPVAAEDIVLSIADAPTLEETGDTGTTDLAFALTATGEFTGDMDVTFDQGGSPSSATVSFTDGAGVLTIPVANDVEDNGDDTVSLTLTGASATGETIVVSSAASASGTVTEDDTVEPTILKGDFVFGINVGAGVNAPAVTDSNGNLYAAADLAEWTNETGYNPASANEKDHDGDGSVTDDDEIYDSELYGLNGGDLTFTRAGIPAGDYVLTLKLAEIFGGIVNKDDINGNANGGVGARVIDYTVNGILAVDDADIFAEAGVNSAYDIDIAVTIPDEGNGTGTLTVVGSSSIENAKINGLALFEVPAVTVSASDVTVSEEDGTATVVFTREGNTETDMVITFSTADGSATAGEDYTAATAQTVTIPIGAASVTAQIALTGDALEEGDETFTVTIDSAVAPGVNVTSTGTPATVTLTDDDAVDPIFERGDVVAAFNAGGGALTQDGIDFAAAPSGTNGAPFSGGDDFTDNGGGNDLQPVYAGTVYETEINDGGKNDGTPDTFSFSLSEGIDPAKSYFVDLYFAEIYTDVPSTSDDTGRVFDVLVEDDDPDSPTLDNFDIVATTGNADTPIVVQLPDPISPGANGAIDLTFNAEVDRGKVSAIVIREAIDTTAVSVSVADVTVSEEDGSATVVFTREGNTETDMVITFSTADGSATAGEDYTAVTSQTVTIPAGETSASADITLTAGDEIEDGDEAFTVTIESAVSTGANVTLADATATVTLTDDDAPDPDDIDGDGVLNTADPFAYDGTNGDARVLVAGGEFTQDFNTDTTNPFDADGGFSGILVNPAFDYPGKSEADPYGNRTNEGGVSISDGTLSVLSTETDAFPTSGEGANNTLADGYQSAVDVTGLDTFEVHARASSEDWLSKVTSTNGFEQFGITLGAGGVDDFVKLVIGDGGVTDGEPNAPRVQLAHNNSLVGGENNYPFGGTGPSVDLALVGDVEFRLIVDRTAGENGQITGQVDFFAADGGALLESYTAPAVDILANSSLIAAMDGQNPLTGGDGGLAYGIFVTDWSAGDSNRFTADYDFLTIRALDNDPATVTLENVIASIPEDADTSGTIKVADIVVTDDGAGTNTLSLSGDDVGLYTIVDGDTGPELHIAADAALDFETNPTLNVTVAVDDPEAGGSTANLSLTVDDVNEAPSLTVTPVLAEISEGADVTGSTKVADITVTDDALGTNDLLLTGNDATLFEIVGTVGALELHLKADTTLDFETAPTLDVTVTLDDATIGAADTLEGSVPLSLAVTNVDERTQTTDDPDTLPSEGGDSNEEDIVEYTGTAEVGTSAAPYALPDGFDSFSATGTGTVNVKGNANNNVIGVGSGANDTADLTSGGADTVTGTGAELDGTTVTGFGADDRITVEGGGTVIEVETGSTIIKIDTDGDADTIESTVTLAETIDPSRVKNTVENGNLVISVEGNTPPTLVNEIPDQTRDEDVPFSFAIPAGTFDDDLGEDALTLTARLDDGTPEGTDLPDWLSFDGTAFTGTPLQADVDAGPITVNVTATDVEGASVTDSFVLTPTNVNDAPVAGDDTGEGFKGFPASFTAAQLLGNDDDEDGDTLSVTEVSNPSTGTVELADGVVTFTPAPTFSGDATFDYTIADGNGGTDTGTVTVTVIDGAPVQTTDVAIDAAALSSYTLPGSVQDADSDAFSVADDGSSLSITGNSWKALALDAPYAIVDGSKLRFTFSSDDLAEISAIGLEKNDVLSGSAPQQLLFGLAGSQLNSLNAELTGLVDPLYTTEDGVKTYEIDLSDFAGESYTSLVFINDADQQTGNGTFADIKFVEPIALNSAPVAGDDSFSVAAGGVLSVTPAMLLANDTDADADDTLSLTSVGNAQGGTVEIDADTGQVVFTPADGVTGSASFDYTVSDGQGGTDTGTVNVTVGGATTDIVTDVVIADTPALSSYHTQDKEPAAYEITDDGDTLTITGNSWKKLALPEAYEVTEDTVLRFSFSSDDLGEIHAIGLETDNALGGATASEQVFFQLAGSDGFSRAEYTATPISIDPDGTQNFEIELGDWAGQSFPFIVFANDVDDPGETANSTFSNVQFVEPNVVTGVNTAPVAGADAFEVEENDSLTLAPGALLTNDSDADGDDLSIVSVSNAVGGTVAIDNVGRVVFTPTPDTSGAASFEYTISDGKGGSDTATVDVTVVEEGTGETSTAIDFSFATITSYSGQDARPGAGATVGDAGNSLTLDGNVWKDAALADYEVTANTVLRFDLTVDTLGEIHGIGLDNDDDPRNGAALFQLFGTQNWARADQTYADEYTTLGSTVSYEIDLSDFEGQIFDRLSFISDHDNQPRNAESTFANVRLVETLPGTDTGEAPYIFGGEIADQVLSEDTAFEFNLPILDDDSPTFTLTFDGLPSFLTADGTFLSGTPLNADVGSYDVTVTATDPQLNSVTDTFTVTVENVNDAPVAAADALPSAEGVIDSELSIALPADFFTDEDAGDSLTYSLVGTVPPGLSINATTGEITGAPESAGSFTFGVRATDQSGVAFDEAALTLTVADGPPRESVLIEAEDFDGLSPSGFRTEVTGLASGNELIRLGVNSTGTVSTDLDAAGAAPGFYDLAITYLDENDGTAELTVLIDNGDGPQQVGFQIFDATDLPGQGSGLQAGNYQVLTIPSVEVKAGATLILEGVSEGREVTRIDKVELTPVDNGAPVFTSDAAVTVAENGTDVTTVVATDPEGQDIAYAIAGGADENLFDIDGSTGALSFKDAPDFEAPGDVGADNVYDVLVSASDGAVSSLQTVSVTVTDENAAPTVTLTPVLTTIAENADTTAAIKVADIAITDDGEGTNALGLTGDDADLFEIVTTDGASELFLKAGTTLNLEDNASLDVSVTVDDVAIGDAAEDQADLSVTVTEAGPPNLDPVPLLRINAFGPEVAATDNGPDWLADGNGAPNSTYLTTTNDRGDTQGYSGDPAAVPSEVPVGVLDTARSSNAPFSYSIPVEDLQGNGNYIVKLYLAELFDGNQVAGDRVFDIGIEGVTEGDLDNVDPSSPNAGGDLKVVTYEVEVTDGFLDLSFAQDAIDGSDNPIINAIEILSNPAVGQDTDAPTAAITLTNPAEADAPVLVDIALSDASGIDETTLGAEDIVLSVNGFPVDANITFTGFADGVASYEIAAPDGGWSDGLDISVALKEGEVADLAAAANTNVATSQALSLEIGGGSTGGGDDEDVVVYRINAGGATTLPATDGGPDWIFDGADPNAGPTVEDNPYFNGADDRGDFGGTATSTFAGVPDGIFENARSSDFNFSYDIPTGVLENGENYEVRLYFAEIFAGGQSGGFRTFDATVEGIVPASFNNIDPGALFGADGGMLSAQVKVTDGELNLGFLTGANSGPGGQQNPIISGIEIVKLGGEIDGPPDPSDPSFAVNTLTAASGVDSGGSYGANAVGSAELKVMENVNNIQSSNFGGGSFQLENTGDKEIAGLFIDFRDALYRDSVVDFDGSGGDTAAKLFQVDGNNTVGGYFDGIANTYFLPGETPEEDPDVSGSGVVSPVSGGYRGLLMKFDGSNSFGSGESVGFSGDMDPNSVAGLPKSGQFNILSGATDGWDVGGVSGAEIVGSSFTVLFDDGTTATGYLGSNDNQAGSVGKAIEGAQEQIATVTVNGATSDVVGQYGETVPEIVVTGPAGATVKVVMTRGHDPVNNSTIDQLVADRLAEAHPEFAVSNAADFQTFDVTLDGTGTATLPEGAFTWDTLESGADVPGFETAPIAVAAAVVDGDNNPLGPVDRVYAQSNGTPVTGGGTGGGADGYYQIVNGNRFKIQIEDENANGGQNPGGKWNFVDAADDAGNQNNFQGDGYYLFGSDTSTAINGVNNNEVLEYTIFIPDSDIGTFNFSMRVSRDGVAAGDQQNDLWLNFKKAGTNESIEDYLVEGDNEPEPTNDGFIKVFGGPNNGNWGNATNWDGLPGNPATQLNVTEGGLYTIEIAGRSQGLHVDSFQLYKGGAPGNGASNSAFIEGAPGDGGGGATGADLVIPIDASADDWEERGGAGSGDFEIGENGGPQWSALRFDGINIPDGAVIENAFIRFQADGNQSGQADFTIAIEDSENAAGYSGSNLPVDRNYDADEFTWSDVPAWTDGQIYDTPDISALIEDVIGADGVDDGALGFFFEGDGKRAAVSFDGNGAAPELHIVFAEDDNTGI